MDFFPTKDGEEWGLPAEAVEVASGEFRLEEPVYRSLDIIGPSALTNPHLAASLVMPSLSRSTAAPGISLDDGVDQTIGILDSNEPPSLPVDMSLFPLEQTHFYTNTNPGAVVAEISKALSAHKVQSTFNAKKYKFKCEFGVFDQKGNLLDKIEFRARIYTVNQHKKYVVELQKRQGCSLQWRKLFNDLKGTIPLERITQ